MLWIYNSAARWGLNACACVVCSVAWQQGKNNCHSHAAYWSDRLPLPYLNITYKQQQRVTQPSPRNQSSLFLGCFYFLFLAVMYSGKPSLTQTHTCMHTYCTHTYIYSIYIYIYIYTHTHTHTHSVTQTPWDLAKVWWCGPYVCRRLNVQKYKCNQMNPRLYTPALSIICKVVNVNCSPSLLQSMSQ